LLPEKIADIIEVIKYEYENSEEPWIIAFSGGKDSSALLKLLFAALMQSSKRDKLIKVIYCDTGVDIPPISDLVRDTMADLLIEAKELNLPIEPLIVYPKLSERFFVKVIGRGYPPPTNKFRWCTDKLRIDPIQTMFSEINNTYTVMLGVRKDESSEREKIIEQHRTGKKYYFTQSDSANCSVFSPIIEFSTRDVWETILLLDFPKAIDTHKLAILYKEASGECPIFRDAKDAPCGKGRFGCWTCTVVRKDKAMLNLISSGYINLTGL